MNVREPQKSGNMVGADRDPPERSERGPVGAIRVGAIRESPLPDGWRWVRLGDVCEENTGTRNPRSNPDQIFRYVDITSVDNATKRIVEAKTLFGKDAPSRARQVIRAGDVIVSTTRPNLNAVALVPTELDSQICSTGFCVLRAKEELDHNYLFAFVQSSEFAESLSELVKGALYPAVTDSQVRDQYVPLPPLPEQKRIAAILNEQLAAVERARAAAEAQLQAAKALPAAYLREVFESEEARGWERTTLANVCRDISDGTHFTPEYLPAGVPFLSVKDVKETGISFDDCRFISEEQHQELRKRCKPERGDVLYTKVGTTGIAKAIDTDREFSIFVSVALLKLRPTVLPEYLERMLNSPLCRKQAENLTQGMANRNLVLQDLKRIEILLPPLEEERHISKMLSAQMASVEQTRKTLEAQLAAIEQLPAALLRRAFAGEL